MSTDLSGTTVPSVVHERAVTFNHNPMAKPFNPNDFASLLRESCMHGEVAFPSYARGVLDAKPAALLSAAVASYTCVNTALFSVEQALALANPTRFSAEQLRALSLDELSGNVFFENGLSVSEQDVFAWQHALGSVVTLFRDGPSVPVLCPPVLP